VTASIPAIFGQRATRPAMAVPTKGPAPVRMPERLAAKKGSVPRRPRMSRDAARESAAWECADRSG
jgi:hypothetical protein